jgi:hypothetical protein
LLIRLKDIAGLKYIEIIEIPPFDNLKLPSLGKLYRDAKARMQNKRTDGKNEKKSKKVKHRPRFSPVFGFPPLSTPWKDKRLGKKIKRRSFNSLKPTMRQRLFST